MRPACAALAVLLILPHTDARATPPTPDKSPSRFAKLGDLRVHYKSLGAGKTALVLVHGWCCDLTVWDDLVPALAGKVRVILIDLPGHGKSDRPKIEYTMDLFARAVDAVLKDAGVEQAALAGHSMGTPVVRQYYRLFPKKTRALIAVDGAFRRFTKDPAVLDKIVAQFSGPDFKEKAGKFLEAMLPPKTPAKVRERIRAAMQNVAPHAALSAMKGMFDPAVWKDDKIEVPVQAIMARSKFWTAEYEEYVRKLAPKLDYRVMDGVGHFLMLERPAEFNEILIGFLKKQGLWAGAEKTP
jgi:pimeloyl-ACP methyl ester carboxylesterase